MDSCPTISTFFFLITFLLAFGSSTTQATHTRIDSLKAELEKDLADTARVKTLNRLAWQLRRSNPDTAIQISKNALELARNEGWKKGVAKAHENSGVFYDLKGDFQKALEHDHQALDLYQELGDRPGSATLYSNIGAIHHRLSNYPKALEYFFKALQMNKELGRKTGVAINLVNIGVNYYGQSDYSKALEYYSKALKATRELGNKSYVAAILGNIGNLQDEQGNYTKALEYHSKALKIAKELGNKDYIATTLGNIGSLYLKVQRVDTLTKGFVHPNGARIPHEALLDSAINKVNRSHFLKKEIGNKAGITFSLTDLGIILIRQEKPVQALRYFKKAHTLSENIGAMSRKMAAARRLYETYKTLGKPDSALFWHEKYTAHKDSIFNEEKQKKIGRMESRFEWQQKLLKQKKEQEKQEALAKEQERQQNIIIASVSGGLLLVLVFAFVIFNRLKLTRKQKGIIEDQKALVEEKQEEVMDSITYAQRIQTAMLQSEEHQNPHLPEHFILFKPKDVVSGDFYWVLEKQGYLYITAADCTGHGVPGAFMSMLGIAFLNEINSREELLTPAEILDELRERIIKELGQTGEEGEARDGMDMSLVRIKLDQKGEDTEMMWAGANNPLYHIKPLDGQEKERDVQDETHYLQDISPDKQAIGYDKTMKPFTNHELTLKKGDSIYLFSDGYADQFGGPKGKKFKYKPFKRLLIENRERSMDEQKQVLYEEFEEWKGEMEQVDDVVVVAVRR